MQKLSISETQMPYIYLSKNVLRTLTQESSLKTLKARGDASGMS